MDTAAASLLVLLLGGHVAADPVGLRAGAAVEMGRAENPAAVGRPSGPYGATLQSASTLCSWMFFIWKSASARLATSGNVCARGRASLASCSVMPADFARRTSFHSFSR